MDELLTTLNNRRTGGLVASATKVAALAFADDVILFEHRDLDMIANLDTVAMEDNQIRSARPSAQFAYRGSSCPGPNLSLRSPGSEFQVWIHLAHSST